MVGHQTPPERETLIVGIDPATAKDKPLAIVLVRFRVDNTRDLLAHDCGCVTEHVLEKRFEEWLNAFEWIIGYSRRYYGREPDMTAVEDVRSRGRGGAHIQTLITLLCERAERRSIRCERINPQTVKKHAAGHGRASTEQVALAVRAEYQGMDRVAIKAGQYDMEMAVAVAGAGYAILQEEAIKESE